MTSAPHGLNPSANDSEAAPQGRAAALRAATAPQHRDAESRGFIVRLMAGELSIDHYTAYLAQYAYVYRALEHRPQAPGDPALLHEGSLARFGAIVSDLENLGAADWEESHPPLHATTEYVARLMSIDPLDVPRYLAHHYTRYLGDLSGGQAIAALVARHYGAVESQLSFYRFEQVDSPVTFKRSYREALDALDFDSAQDSALIDEAKLAFELNAAIFDALDARVGTAAA